MPTGDATVDNAINLNEIFEKILGPFIIKWASKGVVVGPNQKESPNDLDNKVYNENRRLNLFFPYIEKKIWDEFPEDLTRTSLLKNEKNTRYKLPHGLYKAAVNPISQNGINFLVSTYEYAVKYSVAAHLEDGWEDGEKHELDEFIERFSDYVDSEVVAAKTEIMNSLKENFAPVFEKYGISLTKENAIQGLAVLVIHTLLHQFKLTGTEAAKQRLQYTFDRYLADISAKTADGEKLSIKVPCAVISESYFDQTLYDKQGNPIFKVSAQNFDEIKNKHILIIGDGGQGKTTFLQRIRDVAGSKEDVRYCRLAGLGKQALDKHDGESVIFKSLNNQKEITNNCTLLLDGFNETYKDGAEAAAAIAKEIAEIAEQNATIIVTSRAGNATAFPDEFRRFELHTISGVLAEASDEYCNSHPDFPAKLKPLLRIPMYYNYIKDAEETPKSQYELLEGLYRRQFMQSDRSACAYAAFYVLVPWVIHKEGSHTVIDGQSLDRAARQLSKNPALSEALFYASLELSRNGSVKYSFDDVDVKESYRLLRANGPFSIDAEDNSFVIHESIADYLKSFSELLVLRAIQNCWESDVLGREEALQALSGLSVECGSLSDLSRKLLVEELGLDGDPSTANAAMERMYENILKRQRIAPDEIGILYGHTAFILSDFLGLGRKTEISTTKILKKVIQPVEDALECGELILEEPLRARCKKALLEMISKMIEYDRVASRYELAFELISLAEQISSDDRALASITNQKGKLLLAMHRDFSCDGTSVLEPFTGKEDDLLLDGLALLEKNCEIGYNISCALVGMIYSEIAPYLIRSGIKIDVIKAFCTYLQVVKKRAEWRDRKIGYTTRKAIMLLLCGRVSVKTRFFDLRDLESYQESDFAVGDNNPNPMNLSENALALVRILVDLLYGETSGLAYAKGVLALRDGDLQRAKAYFESEPEWIQNQIMLNHFCDANFDLAGAYEKLEKNKKNPLYEQNGFVDQAHSVYTLLACTNLQIALNGKASVDVDRVKGEFPEEVQDVIECLRVRAPE